MRVISYGGGVQSTSLLVLAATGVIDADVAVFANVGDDSEHPATLRYVREVAVPYATAHGLPVEEVARDPWPSGAPRTLLSHLHAYNGCQACGATPGEECRPECPSTRNTGGDLPIPMKIEPLHVPIQRSCTKHWKLVPIRRWLVEHGATEAEPATVMLGISTDEWQRATTRREPPVIDRPVFPLLDLGYSRASCRQVIADAGLPVPGKSACWYCPYHHPMTWAERRRDEPELYARAVELEDHINDQRDRRHLSPVRFLSGGRRLAELPAAQPTLFGDTLGGESCDEGVCFV